MSRATTPGSRHVLSVFRLLAAGLVLAACSSGAPARRHAATTTTGAPVTSAPPTTAASTTTTSTVTGPAGGPVPAGFVPQSVTFVSTSTGWVLGTATCASPPCTSILRTRDGGATWRGIPAPRTPLGSGTQGEPGVSTLRFADPLDGWAFGSELWSTHDGGSTWHRITLPATAGAPASVRSLEVAAGTAYLLDIPGNAESTAGTAQVFTTPVGTDAWTPDPGAAVPGATSGVVVVQGTAAWVALTTSQGGSVFLARSGAGWVRRRLPCDQPSLTVAAATPSDLVAVCASGAGAGQQPKASYTSVDGGSSWRAAGSAPLAGDTLGVAMASPSTIVISAASGASWLYASFDGGRTWRTVYTDTAGGGLPWRDLGFTSATQGVVIEAMPPSARSGTGQVFVTRDGGHTWSALSLR